MFDFIKLKAYNFVHYHNLEIDFRKFNNDLIFISGENRDVAGAGSNGSGKSVVGDIIADLLFDKTIRGHSPKSFIGNFDKWSYSSLLLKERTTKILFQIEKYRNHRKFKDKLSFYKKEKGEKKILLTENSKAKKDIYKFIHKALDINWETFKNRNFYGQEDQKRFLNVTDAKKAEIIIDIQDLKDLQECKKISHEKLKTAKKNEESCESNVEQAESSMDMAKFSKDEIEREMNEFKTEIVKKIESLLKKEEILKENFLQEEKEIEKESKKINKEILNFDSSKLESFLEEGKKKEKEFSKFKRSLFTLVKQEGDLKEECVSLESEIGNIKKKKTKTCDKCGAKLNELRIKTTLKNLKEHWKKNLEERERLKNNISVLALRVENKKEEIVSFEQKYDPFINKKEDFSEQVKNFEKWRRKHSRLETQLSQIQKERQIFSGQKNNPPGTKSLDSILSKLKELSNKFSERKREHKKAVQERKKYEVSERVFEITIRTLFENFLETLNYYSNSFLEVLSDGDITIQASSKTEKKSKKIVDEISVMVTIGDEDPRNFNTLSGGEKGRIELSVQLALFSSSDCSIPLLFLDEPMVGISPEGEDRIIELLKQKSDKGNKILLTSHHDLIAGYGDSLKVIRENGESKVFIN